MAVNEVFLRQGRQANLDAGSIGVVYADAGHAGDATRVRVAVMDDAGERDHTLAPGDTFRLGGQTWRLDRVEGAERPDWTVVLIRVE